MHNQQIFIRDLLLEIQARGWNTSTATIVGECIGQVWDFSYTYIYPKRDDGNGEIIELPNIYASGLESPENRESFRRRVLEAAKPITEYKTSKLLDLTNEAQKLSSDLVILEDFINPFFLMAVKLRTNALQDLREPADDTEPYDDPRDVSELYKFNP